MQSTWIVIFPEILIAAGGLLIFCAGAFWRRRPEKLLFFLALIFLTGAVAASASAPMAGMSLSGMLDSEGYTRIFSVLVLSAALMTLLFS